MQENERAATNAGEAAFPDKAAARNRLAYMECEACGEAYYYPRPLCPFCMSEETRWKESAGDGTIYSYSVTQKADGPQVLAFVYLAEGFSILTNIVDCAAEDVAIGAPVEVSIRDDAEGRPIPCFRIKRGG